MNFIRKKKYFIFFDNAFVKHEILALNFYVLLFDFFE